MERQKAADEVFCTSCGAAIKKRAELCPECGVRNENQSVGGGGGGASRSRSTGQVRSDAVQTETTVSDSWWYGVAGFTGLWVVLLVIAGNDAVGSSAFLGFVLLGTWIGLPLTAYYDIKYVSSRSQWQPNPGLWMLGLLVWIVNIPLAAIYLYRRHETVGVP